MKNTENKIYHYENNKLTYPENEVSYCLEQSNFLVFSGNIYAALETVEKAINLKKDYVAAYYQKARILFTLGKKSEAEVCFKQASKLEGFLLDDEVAQKYYYNSYGRILFR